MSAVQISRRTFVGGLSGRPISSVLDKVGVVIVAASPWIEPEIEANLEIGDTITLGSFQFAELLSQSQSFHLIAEGVLCKETPSGVVAFGCSIGFKNSQVLDKWSAENNVGGSFDFEKAFDLCGVEEMNPRANQ